MFGIHYEVFSPGALPYTCVIGVRGALAWENFPNERQHVLAFTERGVVVGVLAAVHRGDAAYVGAVWVAARYRRRGIASRMLRLTGASCFVADAVTSEGHTFLRTASRKVIPGLVQDARTSRERARGAEMAA